MPAKKVIVVFGATGNQGGSVARTILGDSLLNDNWTVRGVTRDVTKPSAKALQSLGAEVVSADLNDTESLKRALAGAYAVFAVTNYWEIRSGEGETKQGKAIVDASKEAGVQHFIWSSLLNIKELSKGALPNVTHFDSKAAVESYARATGIPATFFLPGGFASMFPGGNFRQAEDGVWTLALPTSAKAVVPLFVPELDTGKFVKAILLNREKTLGKRIYGATDYYTAQQLVDEFKEVFPEAGKTARFVELPHEVFKGILKSTAGFSDQGAQELLENLRLLDEFGYYGGASLDETHSLVVDKLTTWKEYIKTAPAFANLK